MDLSTATTSLPSNSTTAQFPHSASAILASLCSSNKSDTVSCPRAIVHAVFVAWNTAALRYVCNLFLPFLQVFLQVFPSGTIVFLSKVFPKHLSCYKIVKSSSRPLSTCLPWFSVFSIAFIITLYLFYLLLSLPYISTHFTISFVWAGICILFMNHNIYSA